MKTLITTETTREPFLSMNDENQWKEGLNALKEGKMVEMCEDSYDHFLNCVPPLDFCGVSYICSEAYNHNDEGKGIYLCAIQRGGRFFAQHGTIKQYRNRELFK